MQKTFCIVGTDARQRAAARALQRAGYAVTGAESAGNADYILLPMPLDAYYVSIMSERYRHAKWPVAKGMLAGLRAALCTVGKPEGSSSLTYVMRRGDGNVG